MSGPHYTRKSFAEALRAAGVRAGDVVFSHSNVGFFGVPEDGRTAAAVVDTIYGAFAEVLGDRGTLVVPTFTYSFCRHEPFDVERTPSVSGLFSEAVRQFPRAHRSLEPIFSVAAVGGDARELTAEVSRECFGRDSFWDRLFQRNGLISNLNFDAGSTFIHYVERCLGVPYRFDKAFSGTIIERGRSYPATVIYFCRDLSNPSTDAAFEPFHTLAVGQGLASCVPVGRGSIVAIRARDTYRLIEDTLQADPWLLTVSATSGPPAGRPPGC